MGGRQIWAQVTLHVLLHVPGDGCHWKMQRHFQMSPAGMHRLSAEELQTLCCGSKI